MPRLKSLYERFRQQMQGSLKQSYTEGSSSLLPEVALRSAFTLAVLLIGTIHRLLQSPTFDGALPTLPRFNIWECVLTNHWITAFGFQGALRPLSANLRLFLGKLWHSTVSREAGVESSLAKVAVSRLHREWQLRV